MQSAWKPSHLERLRRIEEEAEAARHEPILLPGTQEYWVEEIPEPDPKEAAKKPVKPSRKGVVDFLMHYHIVIVSTLATSTSFRGQVVALQGYIFCRRDISQHYGIFLALTPVAHICRKRKGVPACEEAKDPEEEEQAQLRHSAFGRGTSNTQAFILSLQTTNVMWLSCA